MAHEATHVVQQGDAGQRSNTINRFLDDISISSIGESIASGASTVVDYGRAGIEMVGEGVGAVVEAGRSGFISIIRQFSPGLADFIERGPLTVIRERIESTIGGWFSGLSARINPTEAIAGLKNWFSNAFSILQGAVTGDSRSCASFSALLDGFFGFARNIIHSEFVQSIKSTLTRAHDIFAEIVSLYVETNIENMKLVWGGLKSFAGTLGEWIASARNDASEAWDWIAEQLGLSGQGGGITEWLKEKAGEVWQTIKEDIAPAAFEGFKAAGKVLYRISGLEAFYEITQAGRSFISAMSWLWNHRNDPDLATSAAEDPAVKDTILPQLLTSAKNFGGIIEGGLSSLAQQANMLVGLLLTLVGNIAGLPILRRGVGLVNTINQP